MKYGLNLLLWTDRMHEGLVPVLGRVKALGYDGVEIPIFELNEPLHAQWGRRLDDLGLERTAVTVRNAGDNPISPSATVRAAAVDAMRKTIDCCRAAGIKILCGPTHSAIGEFTGTGPTEDEFKWASRFKLWFAVGSQSAMCVLISIAFCLSNQFLIFTNRRVRTLLEW